MKLTKLNPIWLLTSLTAAALCGCGPPDPGGVVAVPGPVVDPSDAVFDPSRVLEISIAIDPDDWEELRHQERHYLDVLGPSCNVEPPERPYTYFPADIEIDGELVANVGVRKKGFFGSVNDDKPSLKVSFTEYVDGRRYAGLTRLTLNNNIPDPSQIKQCLGYGLFRLAGVPASRCNFAVVEVNGQPLGTFSNVESIKKPFLARNFGDDEGNLYEGTLADFRPGFVNMFERKTNKDDPDRSDVEELVPLMEADDEVLLEAIEPLIDLERFYDLWAMEVILMHGDGYARNTNNYYIYNDPQTGRFTFVPWGIDVILQPDQTWSWEQQPPPGVAWAVGVLTHRLYRYPPTRDAYLARIQHLLDQVWHEDEILAEIDRMVETLDPHITGYEEFIAEKQDEVRDYVVSRRGQLEAILAQPPADWDEPLRDPWCLDQVGDVSGDFTAGWGTLDAADPFAEGSGLVDLTVHDETHDAQPTAAIAGLDENEQPRIELLFWAWDLTALVIELQLDELDLDTALPHEFEIEPGEGAVYEVAYDSGGDPVSSETRAQFGGGSLLLEQIDPTDGGTVSGSFDGVLYPHGE
jgi:hypothetical protein